MTLFRVLVHVDETYFVNTNTKEAAAVMIDSKNCMVWKVERKVVSVDECKIEGNGIMIPPK